jgi:hypothetical protein
LRGTAQTKPFAASIWRHLGHDQPRRIDYPSVTSPLGL